MMTGENISTEAKRVPVPSPLSSLSQLLLLSSSSSLKGKFVHVHTLKAYSRSRYIPPLILNLDTRRR
jgi:hypothetical protein